VARFRHQTADELVAGSLRPLEGRGRGEDGRRDGHPRRLCSRCRPRIATFFSPCAYPLLPGAWALRKSDRRRAGVARRGALSRGLLGAQRPRRLPPRATFWVGQSTLSSIKSGSKPSPASFPIGFGVVIVIERAPSLSIPLTGRSSTRSASGSSAASLRWRQPGVAPLLFISVVTRVIAVDDRRDGPPGNVRQYRRRAHDRVDRHFDGMGARRRLPAGSRLLRLKRIARSRDDRRRRIRQLYLAIVVSKLCAILSCSDDARWQRRFGRIQRSDRPIRLRETKRWSQLSRTSRLFYVRLCAAKRMSQYRCELSRGSGRSEIDR